MVVQSLSSFSYDFFKLATNLCAESDGWITAKIASKDSSVGYHEFANTSKTWCLKVLNGLGEGQHDKCVHEGAKRITFGEGRKDFAAAFIEVLAQNVCMYRKQ